MFVLCGGVSVNVTQAGACGGQKWVLDRVFGAVVTGG